MLHLDGIKKLLQVGRLRALTSACLRPPFQGELIHRIGMFSRTPRSHASSSGPLPVFVAQGSCSRCSCLALALSGALTIPCRRKFPTFQDGSLETMGNFKSKTVVSGWNAFKKASNGSSCQFHPRASKPATCLVHWRRPAVAVLSNSDELSRHVFQNISSLS